MVVTLTLFQAISSTSPKDREGEISYLKAHFLQRDVKIILKEFSNEKGLIGSVTVAIETDVTELLIKDVSERRVDSRALGKRTILPTFYFCLNYAIGNRTISN